MKKKAVKVYVRGTTHNSLVKIDFDGIFFPIYSPDRRVELPTEYYEKFIKEVRRGCKDNAFTIILSYPDEKDMKSTCIFIHDNIKVSLLSEVQVLIFGLKDVFNFAHTTYDGKYVEIYPEFRRVASLNQKEKPHAWKQRINDDRFLKKLKRWKVLLPWTYIESTLYLRTEYYVEAYSTNPVPAMEVYPVYVSFTAKDPRNHTKDVKKDGWLKKLVNYKI